MKSFEHIHHYDGFYRGHDLGPGNLESSEALDAPLPTQVHNLGIDAKAVDPDGHSSEREKEIEQWMENIKSFIRKIDVSSL